MCAYNEPPEISIPADEDEEFGDTPSPPPPPQVHFKIPKGQPHGESKQELKSHNTRGQDLVPTPSKIKIHFKNNSLKNPNLHQTIFSQLQFNMGARPSSESENTIYEKRRQAYAKVQESDSKPLFAPTRELNLHINKPTQESTSTLLQQLKVTPNLQNLTPEDLTQRCYITPVGHLNRSTYDEGLDMWKYIMLNATGQSYTTDTLPTHRVNSDLIEVHNDLKLKYCREHEIYNYESLTCDQLNQIIQDSKGKKLLYDIIPSTLIIGEVYIDNQPADSPWYLNLTPELFQNPVLCLRPYYIKTYLCYIASVSVIYYSTTVTDYTVNLATFDVMGNLVVIRMPCADADYDEIKLLEGKILVFNNLKVGLPDEQLSTTAPILTFRIKQSRLKILWSIYEDVYLFGPLKGDSKYNTPLKTKKKTSIKDRQILYMENPQSNQMVMVHLYLYVTTCLDQLSKGNHVWTTKMLNLNLIKYDTSLPIIAHADNENFTVAGYIAQPTTTNRIEALNRTTHGVLGCNINKKLQLKFKCRDPYIGRFEDEIKTQTFVTRFYNNLDTTELQKIALIFNTQGKVILGENRNEGSLITSEMIWNPNVTVYINYNNLKLTKCNWFQNLLKVDTEVTNERLQTTEDWRYRQTEDEPLYITTDSIESIANFANFGCTFTNGIDKLYIKLIGQEITNVKYPTIQSDTLHADRKQKDDIFFILCHKCQKKLVPHESKAGKLVCQNPECAVRLNLYPMDDNDPNFSRELISEGHYIDVMWSITLMIGRLYFKVSDPETIRLMTGYSSVIHYLEECEKEGRFYYSICYDPLKDPVIRSILRFIGQGSPLDIMFEAKKQKDSDQLTSKLRTMLNSRGFSTNNVYPVYVTIKNIQLSTSKVVLEPDWPSDSLMFPSRYTREDLDKPVLNGFTLREYLFGVHALSYEEAIFYSSFGHPITETMLSTIRKYLILRLLPPEQQDKEFKDFVLFYNEGLKANPKHISTLYRDPYRIKVSSAKTKREEQIISSNNDKPPVRLTKLNEDSQSSDSDEGDSNLTDLDKQYLQMFIR
jgi:hypothetical protein